MKTRTRQELDREFADYLRGLLMESFQEAARTRGTNHYANGAMMYQQMIRGKELLDRIHNFYCPEDAAKPPQNNTKLPADNGAALKRT